MTNAIADRSRKYMAVMDYGEAGWQSEAMHQNALLHDALTRAQTAEEIGRDFEEDAGQLRAKLAKAVNVIKNLINIAPEGDEDEWHIALDDASEALAEIKGDN